MAMMTTKAAVWALLCVGACSPASAQWQRVLFSGKGESSDVPSPHALSYFTGNPFLRDDGYDLCTACTPADRAQSAQKYAARSIVKPVGVLAGYRIVDVLYYLGKRENGNPTEVKWKSILVQVGPDSFKEIFHLQAFYTTVSIGPSGIIQSGAERVLATMDSDGGNGGGCWEGYWWFDRAGPHSLDFSRLEAAIRQGVPEKTTFGASCAYLSLSSQQVRSWVQKFDARCLACDFVGEVTASFRLDGAAVQPVSVKFHPGDPQATRLDK